MVELDIVTSKKSKKYKRKTMYCKKCGGEINFIDNKCMKCGKKYFIPRLRHLYYLLSLAAIILLLFTTAYYYNISETFYNDKIHYQENYEKTLSELKEMQSTNKKQTQQIEDLTAKIETKENEIVSYKKEISASENQLGKLEKQIENAEKNSDNCVIPSCDNDASMDSFYCYKHKCSETFCTNQRINSISRYCIVHKCNVSNCDSGKSLNSNYCIRHK